MYSEDLWGRDAKTRSVLPSPILCGKSYVWGEGLRTGQKKEKHAGILPSL